MKIKSSEIKIDLWFTEAAVINEKIRVNYKVSILEISKALIKCLKRGGKIILFGNGGSAADAQHIAAELVGRFFNERRALAAIALTTNTSIITAVANDYDYEYVFARQIEAIASKDDIAFGISTSGNSPNVLRALSAARKKGMATVALTGKDGGKVSKAVDHNITIPSRNTAHIQEAHIAIGHILCALIEEAFV
jgi:D-sedoheptulose 7-phosphate isomerase